MLVDFLEKNHSFDSSAWADWVDWQDQQLSELTKN